MDLRPRKIQRQTPRQITTFVTPPYDALDRMLALVMRLRKENIDIFHKIWGDVLRNVFHMRDAIRSGPSELGGTSLASRAFYIPRQYTLNTFVTPPRPPIWTYVTNPDE